MNNKIYLTLFLLANSLLNLSNAGERVVPLNEQHSKYYEAREGFAVIEAEDFSHQAKDSIRRWFRFNEHSQAHGFADADDNHAKGASEGTYIELLPDTRTTHSETLVKSVNFSEIPGESSILSYPIYFNKPGRYYVWARAFSTGTEDNGLHIGINGTWPESGKRLQFCTGKYQWTWSSAQRTDEQHCGVPSAIYFDVDSIGVHNFQISMREDGTELDKFIFTQDRTYNPSGLGPKATTIQSPTLQQGPNLDSKAYVLYATQDFKFSNPIYKHTQRNVLAINATIVEARNTFFKADYQWNELQEGQFNIKLITLSEIDGESEYRLFHNGKKIAEFKNPVTEEDYQEVEFEAGIIKLKPGDMITVESNALSNNKIPEAGAYAFARGRWRSLTFEKLK